VKTLVFALMLQTYNGEFLESTQEIALWRDLNTCIYFARKISLQAQGEFLVPVQGYCIPKWVEETDEVTIF